MYKILLVFFIGIFFQACLMAEEIAGRKKGIFLFSPMVGIITNEVSYSVSSRSTLQTLKDDGNLYGMYLMYVRQKFTIGSLSHYSILDKAKESGQLFFTHYYFRGERQLQPTVGMSVKNIRVYSELLQEDVYPLSSLDVTVNVWATNPTIGISYKDYFLENRASFRITPFVGYFNEQVKVSVSSPGMMIGGQNRNGFKADSYVNMDYVSIGSKCAITLFHAVHFDSKFYFRLKKDDTTYYTVRNRFDLYFSKKFGLSVKYDYFQDKYDKNTFLFFGPSIIF